MNTQPPTYTTLLAEAAPYAEAELAAMKAEGRNVTDEPGMRRNIAAAYAFTAIKRGETIAEVAARLCPAIALTVQDAVEGVVEGRTLRRAA